MTIRCPRPRCWAWFAYYSDHQRPYAEWSLRRHVTEYHGEEA